MTDSARGMPKAVPDVEPATISPREAAERTGLSRTTIRNAIEDKELSAYQDNRRRWHIKPDDLADWMSAREAMPEAKPVAASGTQVPDTENLVKIARLEAELDAERKLTARLDADLRTEKARLDAFLEDRRGQGQGLRGVWRRLTGL